MASCGFFTGLLVLFLAIAAFKLLRRFAHGGGPCGGPRGGWHRFHRRHCDEHHAAHHNDHCEREADGYDARDAHDAYDAHDAHDVDDFSGRVGWTRGRRGLKRGAAYVAWRLDATAEQRRVIEDAARELADAVREQKPVLKHTRSEIADAMRDADFDADRMGELFARHDVALEALRKAIVGSLAQTHDALDADQRAKLARIITRGR